jgi:predicted transposase YbfD/YdcC
VAIVWCIGCPAAGKSTLARSIAARWARERGKKLLAIDCEGDSNFATLPRTAKVEELPALLVRNNAVAFDAMTCEKAELRKLARFVERAGNLVLLIDGAHALLDAHSSAGDAWVRVQRVHRHANLDLIWTTHHLGGDVPQVVQACAPEIFVFRTTSPSALKVLEREYGLDPSRVRELPQGKFAKVQLGFQKTS